MMRVHALALALAFAFVVVVTSRTAAAQPEADAAPGRKITATWSPVHLALPVAELGAELSVAPHIGVGVIAGVGRISDDAKTVTGTAIEAGAQFNYYFLRAFEGLHAGAEVLYLHVSDFDQDVALSGAGLSVGPYAGYKLMTSFGFTFVAQLGVAYLAVRAKDAMTSAEDSKIYPLLNLNLGWSF